MPRPKQSYCIVAFLNACILSHCVVLTIRCFFAGPNSSGHAVRAGRNAIYCKPQTIATLAEPRSRPTMIGPWTGDDASRAVTKTPLAGGHPGGQRSALGTSQPSFVE
jgi:hypothetical protein